MSRIYAALVHHFDQALSAGPPPYLALIESDYDRSFDVVRDQRLVTRTCADFKNGLGHMRTEGNRSNSFEDEATGCGQGKLEILGATVARGSKEVPDSNLGSTLHSAGTKADKDTYEEHSAPCMADHSTTCHTSVARRGGDSYRLREYGVHCDDAWPYYVDSGAWAVHCAGLPGKYAAASPS